MAKKQDVKGSNKKRKAEAGGKRSGKPKNHRKDTKPIEVLDDPIDDLEVSEEDLAFVTENAQHLGFLASLDNKALDKQLTASKKSQKPDKAKSDREGSEGEDPDLSEGEEYERKPRQASKEAEKRGPELLPFKSVTGELIHPRNAQQRPRPSPQVLAVPGIEIEDDAGIEEEEEVEPAVSDEEAASGESDEDNADENLQRQLSPELAELQEFQNTEERQEEVKQQIAVSSTQLLQSPEDHLSNLRTLLAFAVDRSAQVARWAMLSLAAVFKDILPGFRIRLPTEKELGMPVSKEVKKVRDYEAALLRAYQAFLKALLNAARGQRGLGFARAGIRCLCMLLPSLYGFNYSSDLLQAIVPRMAHRDMEISGLCCAAVKTLLQLDAEGSASREAVQLIGDLVKRRKCVCPPAVVSMLFSLQLSEAEASNVKAEGKPRRIGGSKKAPKRRKKQKDGVAADFDEASARPDAASLRHLQSDTLEVLFEVFFRVLKQTAASGLAAHDRPGPPISEQHAASKFPLLEPALQGLVRFSHMISMEYFADILACLLGLIRAPGLPLRLRLSCLLCASNIHKAQGEALTVDRRSLYEAFFDILLPAPLAPLLDDESEPLQNPASAAPRSAPDGVMHTGDAQAKSASPPATGENEATEQPLGVLLTRLATQMMLDQGRGLETARLTAFLKRLAGLALQLEPGAGMGLLAVVDRMLRRNQKLRGLLDNEGSPVSTGQGSPEDGSLEAAASQSKTSTLWELSLCSRHSHPHMAQAARSISAIPIEGSAGLSHPVLSSSNGPEGVAAAYSTVSGAFHPSPWLPKEEQRKGPVRVAEYTAEFEAIVLNAALPDTAQDPFLALALQSRRARTTQ